VNDDMLRYVLFDLDGTLTDSRSGITRSWAHALTSLGREAPALAALEQYIGPPTREVARQLLGSDDPVLVERCVASYRERYATVGLFENAVYPGIDALLPALAADGYTLLICTSKPTVYARRIAEHYGFVRWLRAVYGCELDGTRGDKTELLAYLLEQERIAPETAVMIGDRMHDMHAAQHVGVHAIGVLYGFGSREELIGAGAGMLCESASEIRSLIRELA
jgi:phosphoglycolate phosphatase